MTSCVAEIFTYCSTCKRSIITQRSRISSSRSYDDSIVHRTLLLQCLHEARDGGALLTYRHIYAIYRLTCLVCCTLIKYGINGDGSLSGLTVADYKLTLTPADRNHRVNSLEACLQRFGYWLTEDDTWGLALKRHLTQITGNPALSIKRFSERVHHTADHPLADIQRSDPAGASDGHSLLDLISRSQKHSTHIILLKVHHDGFDAILELQKLACLCL